MSAPRRGDERGAPADRVLHAVRADGGEAKPGRRAVFLDRDGTLTQETDWVRAPEDLVLLPGASDAVRTLRDAGYAAILVTNQSAVARGMLSEDALAAVHDHLAAELARGGATLDAVYYCPHHPTEGIGSYRTECDCRKPRPGLLRRAAREHALDLARSWIVGDAERDLAAGIELCVPGILVATGKGRAERDRLVSAGRPPAHFQPDVLAAARWIAARDQTR